MNILKISFISPALLCLLVALLSALSLAAALIGQYGFGLHPCELCIYQRIPFAVVIILGLGGYFLPRFSFAALGLSAFAFFTNAAIAVFHSGVERKWWAGLTGCTTPSMENLTIEELLARINATAVVRCDEIPWSLFGLSMANYNVLLCLAAGIFICAYLFKLKRR